MSILEILFKNNNKADPAAFSSSGEAVAPSPRSTEPCQKTYARFLNDYIAHGFAEEEGECEVQAHFYAQALELCRCTGCSELEASHLAEQERQKARRNYRQLMEIASEVLIDQRNYLLASQINNRAIFLGFPVKEGCPFSGIETKFGQPCHAFALKLLADSSLGRGPAAGLCEEAVTLLEHHIAHRAQTEVSYFLFTYAQEHTPQ